MMRKRPSPQFSLGMLLLGALPSCVSRLSELSTAATSSTVPDSGGANPLGSDIPGSSTVIVADAEAAPGTASASASVPCSAGEYAPSEASAEDAATHCFSCEPGTFSAEPGAIQCDAHTVCGVGSFVVAAGTKTHDTECQACAVGSFSSEVNAPGCTPWSDCVAGQFVSSGGSVRADRECSPCEDGKTSTGMNAGACTAEDECSAGTVETTASGTTADRCAPCDIGTYCAGGTAKATPCDEDSWDDDMNPATPCILRTTCSPGQRVDDEGSEVEDRSCLACTDNTFTSAPNAVACTPFTQCLAPDEYEASKPTSVADRTCGTCKRFSLTAENNDVACTALAFDMQDGEAVFEAEDAYSVTSQGAVEAWSQLTVSGVSGDQCMEIGPENGTNWADDPTTTAPRLNYGVYFRESGLFYVYVRGDAGNGTVGFSDSCFVGLDGQATSVYDFTNTGGAWGWVGQTLNVSTVGFHVVSLFAREDGFRVDKLVVTKSTSVPSGNGPPVSSLGRAPVTPDTYL